MKVGQVILRFLVPGFVVSIVCLLRYRCTISHRAEVEVSRWLRIGKRTTISSYTKIKANNGELVIGERVSIGSNCFISADRGGVRIGDYCMIGPGTCIIGNDYRYDKLDVPVALQEKTSKGIDIGRDVWIGSGTVIADGVTIGDHSIIAPNSGVFSSVPARSVVRGNPAEKIFERR